MNGENKPLSEEDVERAFEEEEEEEQIRELNPDSDLTWCETDRKDDKDG